jgi:hypothetical protein
MKRSLIAALFALSAGTVLAGNSEYINEPGQQDLHQPQVADAGSLGNQEQSYPQLG